MAIESAAIDTTATMMKASSNFGTRTIKDLVAGDDLKDMKKINEAAIQFEAVFITEMMKPMFEGIKTDGQFGGGKGEEIFRGVMLEQYGKQLAENGGIGIAKHVKAQLIEIQQTAAQQNAA